MMKFKKVLRILGVALTLAMLLMAIPAAPALAAYSITVDPGEGEVGNPVGITGTGFGESASLIVYFSVQDVDISTTKKINEHVTIYKRVAYPGAPGGNIPPNTSFNVPANLNDGTNPATFQAVHNGRYSLYVTTDADTPTPTILAKAYFIVTGFGTLELDPEEGTVGTEVDITGTRSENSNDVLGSAFAKNEELTVKFDDEEIDIEDGDDATDNSGEFGPTTILIPDSIYGDHTITVVGSTSLAELSDTFSVISAVKVTPVSGLVGATVSINCTGFDRRNDIDIFFGTTKIDDDTNDRSSTDGSFQFVFVVPQVAPGSYTIRAEDEDDSDISATATFAVTVPLLNPNITPLSPTSGKVGDTITVNGTEFGNNKPITLLFDNNPLTPVAPITSGASGSFTGTFIIPASTGGSHTIKAQDDASHSATATLTVTPALTSFTPTSGHVGTTVAITGTGFGASKTMSIAYGAYQLILATPITTGANGSLTGSFAVPAIPGGGYSVTVSDGTNSVSTSFTISTSVVISPIAGTAGTTIAINGTGFGATRNVTITYNNAVIILTTPIVTDASGVLGGTVLLPDSPAGTYAVVVNDGTNTASANFTMQASTSIDKVTSTSAPGNVGMQITISGTGYKANGTITVTYATDPVTLATTTASDKGSFSVTFTIPASAGGSHTITVSDGTNSKQFPFVMETQVPPAPQQRLPLGKDTPEQPITFDWDDVTDLSLPVSYSLQIATDANYATIVLNKTGLTTSGYILTEAEAEALEPTSKDKPYYWRIRSTDAASNNSDWGPNGTFYIGGGWPSWLMWVGIGLGAFVVFIFAVWLGRRIAFSSY
jgi:hypothetical protein